MAKSEVRMIANNKKAYHDYFILEKYEAGIVLHGTEVKSLRMGKCSIKEAFIRVESGEMYIYGMHISPYEKGNIFNKDPLRDIQRADAVIISEKNMYCSAEIPFFIILSEERIFLREAEVSLSVR